MSTLQSDLALMEEAALLAGSCIMDYYRPGTQVAAHVHLKDKSHNNPLTKADLEANQLLRQRLLTHRPDYGWLSEENLDNSERLQRQRVWIIDPMDGTKEFLKGLPQFAVSIGLIENHHPVAACVYNPATRELFSAIHGGGSRLNGHRIQTSQQTELQGASCLASHSETKRGEWERFRPQLTLTPMGSIAYKLALVAAGRFDMTFTLTPKNEWDYCAGALLLREANGQISHKDGQYCLFNQKNPKVLSVLASNGKLHAALLDYLQHTPLSPDRQAVA
ncbi:MAG: 3'(2'),5'-bisphosphate nucleotidase CysQ [Magnetococcales bacterium]|nr:3'(2'),5'-bisphosphate nucleotidase CysQ [Magnetococcales bacterium]